mgnify:CR=1 FL=1
MKNKEWRRSFGVEWLIDSSVFLRFDFGINIGRVNLWPRNGILNTNLHIYIYILCIEYELKMWTLLSLSRTYFIVITTAPAKTKREYWLWSNIFLSYPLNLFTSTAFNNYPIAKFDIVLERCLNLQSNKIKSLIILM